MDPRILPPVRPDVVTISSAPRPTPTPVRVPFQQVLAAASRSIVAGAEGAMSFLPGGPLLAAAVRGAPAPTPMRPMLGGGISAASTLAPEGPAAAGAGTASGAAGTGGRGGESGIEDSLAQAQEMNLYYLQIQEQVNAQNRTFTTLSNVLKAEHDTVKTAIGNIR
jgi:hypothetical protein